MPSECVNTGDVKQFARCSVRKRRVKEDAPALSDDSRDKCCQVRNGQILADTDVQQVGRIVIFHQKARGIGEIIDVKKLPRVRYPVPQRITENERDIFSHGIGESLREERAKSLDRNCLSRTVEIRRHEANLPKSVCQ